MKTGVLLPTWSDEWCEDSEEKAIKQKIQAQEKKDNEKEARERNRMHIEEMYTRDILKQRSKIWKCGYLKMKGRTNRYKKYYFVMEPYGLVCYSSKKDQKKPVIVMSFHQDSEAEAVIDDVKGTKIYTIELQRVCHQKKTVYLQVGDANEQDMIVFTANMYIGEVDSSDEEGKE